MMLDWRDDDHYAPRLTAGAARRVVGDALSFRGERWERPRGLREFDVWIVDGASVVRIARRPEDAKKLERERALLDAINLPVRVPKIERFAHGMAIHRLAPGVPADDPPPPRSAWPAIAGDIASLLSVLHSAPADVAVQASLEPPATVEESRVERLEGALRDLAREDLPPTVESLVDRLKNRESGDTRPLVVSYGDFKGEHVLLSGSRSRVAGVIDWADVELGFPEQDFAGLAAWLGPRFAKLVADQYDGSVDLDAAVADAQYWVLLSLAEAVAGRRDWPLETGWSDADHERARARRRRHWLTALRAVFDDSWPAASQQSRTPTDNMCR